MLSVGFVKLGSTPVASSRARSLRICRSCSVATNARSAHGMGLSASRVQQMSNIAEGIGLAPTKKIAQTAVCRVGRALLAATEDHAGAPALDGYTLLIRADEVIEWWRGRVAARGARAQQAGGTVTGLVPVPGRRCK